MPAGFLPYGRHWIEEDDIQAVADCLRGDWLTTGPLVEEFEQAFARAVGAKHAVVCANGTAALHLAALADGVTPGDACVAPTMSFLASANGMRYAGAEIIFADADPDSGLVTPASFLAAVERAGRPVKMAVIVHLNGHPADLVEIARIAEQHGITLVEDACHALGGRYSAEDGQIVPIGSCSHSVMTVFSLHPVKTVTMGEGGVVTVNNGALYERLKMLRSHGMVREPGRFVNHDMAFGSDGAAAPWYYEMQYLGFNYRATDFACALGLSQLAKLEKFAERRATVSRVYDRHFSDLGETVRPVRPSAGAEPVLHLYPLLIDFAAFGKERAQVMAELRSRGIGTQVHYIPIHRQPYYVGRDGPADMPGADVYYQRALSLPYYPLMEEADAERVVREVKQVLGING
ncbi:MAG: UDP-4-amino-4,6-dideoxy-N-acetyl-beta-L-altrosamine transaminase [Rhizobiaceae bacterium]|nr:UDP-4-amino-4,6-dideoxy-N-acetyl-beta-L-altrosamine transaminase [Rhizobiaceae bacterium]